MCPRGAKLFAGHGGLLEKARLVAHCLLIEAGDQLVLVDTGFGTDDIADPKRLGQPFRAWIAPVIDGSETAIRQIEALGLDPKDVRHIIATHLDVDHAGGLGDFPNAEVHVHEAELQAAQSPPLSERLRYIQKQWAHGPKWKPHKVDGDSWFGFDSVSLLPGVDAEIAMIPLAGHSIGHAGVAVNEGDGWMLHCGDSYFHRDEMATPHSCPPGLRFFQNVVGTNQKLRRHNQERLRELSREHRDDVRMFCSHDPHEFDSANGAAG
jgi:glyoxylase-like metal-dependent hydrolase (beta-lactamase superfamily II)